MKRAQPVILEFKTTHPDLWRAGRSGVAEFIRVVGRGLWTDEATKVSQWRAHSDAAPKRGERGGPWRECRDEGGEPYATAATWCDGDHNDRRVR